MARWIIVGWGIALILTDVLAVARLGYGQTTPLPPGHPSTSGKPAAPPIAPPPAGSGAGAHGLAWTAPPGWTAETPSSPMRRAQYRISGPGGSAECAVFYFGPGQGGDAKANIARWASQFRRADGGDVGKAVKTREITVGDAAVVIMEVTGTYVGGMSGGPVGPERPDYMMLGAIAPGRDANWFFRAIGPRATLEAHRAAFEGMIRSIKRGG